MHFCKKYESLLNIGQATEKWKRKLINPHFWACFRKDIIDYSACISIKDKFNNENIEKKTFFDHHYSFGPFFHNQDKICITLDLNHLNYFSESSISVSLCSSILYRTSLSFTLRAFIYKYESSFILYKEIVSTTQYRLFLLFLTDLFIIVRFHIKCFTNPTKEKKL